MLCVLFGHALPPTQRQLKEELLSPAFSCWRCAQMVMWDNMPKAVRRMRDEYIRRTSNASL